MTPITSSSLLNSDLLKLLVLQPGEDTEGVTCRFEYTSLHDDPHYEVMTYMHNEESPIVTIKLDGHDFSIAVDLDNALTHLKGERRERKFWIESICTSPDDDSRKTEENLRKKHIYTSAQRVLLWIGSNHDDKDPMNAYLGEGTPASTKYAFEFASAMAAAEFARAPLRSVMASVVSSTGLPGWCYLARLLYRPWFRELPLLRTNYVSQLREVVLLCGAASIPWSKVSIAAERARLLQPIPRFIWDTCPEAIWPGMSVEACLEWMRARQIFGFDSVKLVAQILSVIRKVEQPEAAERSDQVRRLTGLLGMATDAFELNDSLYNRLSQIIKAIEIELEDPAKLDMMPVEPYSALPSLPFSGWLASPPTPEFQASFVHTPLDRHYEIRLLVLLPHSGDPASHVQCGLIHASLGNLPSFAYVLNATLKNYQRTSLILVNGQSFRVPQALELFLRHIREADNRISFFVWKICADPSEVSIQWKQPIKYYTGIKDLLVARASSTIDMYTELDNMTDIEVGPLPDGMTKDDWLFDLMDEAEVDDLPS
ncbi:hypothetical protein MMC16_000878 [Acarospora aff. strigata]|nr:hypothetical protein [Acarospora aff. strigata]